MVSAGNDYLNFLFIGEATGIFMDFMAPMDGTF